MTERWTTEQYRQHLAQSGRKTTRRRRQKGEARLPAAGPQFDSPLEADYAEHLQWRLLAKEIRWMGTKPFVLTLTEGRVYTPDFAVQHRDLSMEIHETKGYEWETGMLRFLWAQAQHPWARFYVVERSEETSDFIYFQWQGRWVEVPEPPP